MPDKKMDICEVLGKVLLKMRDVAISDLLVEVIKAIINKPELQVRISTTDYESITFTDENGRTPVTTLGRLMTRRLGFDPCKYSLAIQIINDAYLAEVRKAGILFDIISGADITESYRTAWGAHTCMTDDAAVHTKFLELNKKNVAMLRLNIRGTKARALLWTTDVGTRVLDRIYPNSGWHLEVIYEWAKTLGIVARSGNSLSSSKDTIELCDGNSYTVTVKNASNHWSYMDTFIYGRCLEEEHLYALSNSCESASFVLTTTRGDRCDFKDCYVCHKKIVRNWSECSLDSTALGSPDMPRNRLTVCQPCAQTHTFVCQHCDNRIVGLAKDGNPSCRRCDEKIKAREKKDLMK